MTCSLVCYLGICLLQVDEKNLFSEIKTKCENYMKDHWQNKRKSGWIVPQSNYFETLGTRITNMTKHDLDHFAATHIGDLYNMLLLPTEVGLIYSLYHVNAAG